MAKKDKTLMVAAGLAVAAGVAYWFSQVQAKPPPAGKANLTVEAYADNAIANVPVTVDSQTLTTPKTLQLALGNYTLAAPESISDGTNTFSYVRYEAV